MEISVRDVEPSDAAGLVRVLNPIIEARCYTVLDPPVSVETEFDYIIDFQDRGIWKVAVREPDRTIVGFQVLEPYASYTRAFDHVGILGTYVDLDLRRQGIARRLFAATFDVPGRVPKIVAPFWNGRKELRPASGRPEIRGPCIAI